MSYTETMSENLDSDRLEAEEVLSEAQLKEVESDVTLPLDEQAKQILGANDRGDYTIPAETSIRISGCGTAALWPLVCAI